MTIYKTILAPNAPWPKASEIPVLKPKQKWKVIHISCENDNLDYFQETHDQLNRKKVASSHRVRDKLSGRFTAN
jgi:hypothetical protein